MHDKVELPESKQLWQPFSQFLDRRRLEIHSRLFSGAGLPLHLLEQLDEYLPKVNEVELSKPCDA